MLVKLFYSRGGWDRPSIVFDTDWISRIYRLENEYEIKFKDGGTFSLANCHRDVDKLDKLIMDCWLGKINKPILVLKFDKNNYETPWAEVELGE